MLMVAVREREEILPMDDYGSKSQAKEATGRMRRIVLLVFSGLLALMLVAGLEALRSLRQLDAIERQANLRYAAHNQALTSILISVHLYHDQVERYLADGESSPEQPDGTDVRSRGADVRIGLERYPADTDREEQLLLTEIQQKFLEQENSFAAFIAGPAGAGQSLAEREQTIREQMMLRRAYILRISRDVSACNDRKLLESTRSLTASFGKVQTRLVSMVALSLLAGLLLSLVGGIYILRLERQGRRRYQALVASRQEMQALSMKLVDAQEQERRNISRELHDEVGQTLGALLVELGQLSKRLAPDDGVVQGQIGRIKFCVETAVKSIRDMALLLRPPMLDDLGLVPALEWQGREFSRREELEVSVHSDNISEHLTDEMKVCIYRLVQEALNNTRKHSGAKQASVSVVETGGAIRVEVKDDGKGFAAERVRGMGILGMEERVKRLGGSFLIRSAAGKGTTVNAELPLGRPEPV